MATENIIKLPAPDTTTSKRIRRNAEKELKDALKIKDEQVPLVDLDSEPNVQAEYLKSMKSCVKQVSSAWLRGVAKESLPGLLRVMVHNQIKSQREVLEKLLTRVHEEREDLKHECSVLSRRIHDITTADKKADDIPETATAARKAAALRRRQISKFLDTQFESPTSAEVREFCSTFGTKKISNRSRQGFLTPDELLTNLLNSSSAHYFKASSDVWEPHLEIFLRSGVAVRHPTKPNLVCLSPF
ncbi:centromere protein K-like [Ornithodoros turicata]|uniref:centromere protein K-like n=1 Tax=Ornithodoros turicata TaxID=34597 RepID=UPI00313941C0